MVSITKSSECTTTSTISSSSLSTNTSHSNQNNNSENNVSSSPSNQSSGDPTACLITPSNIHISHMYVYNFTPDMGKDSPPFDSSIIKMPSKYQSPAASSGPICRICHEGDSKEDLVSPCRCTGTVGLVHQTCMERWLSTRCSTNDKCEICNYTFATIRSPKSVLEWIRSDENDATHRRSLMGDFTCFFLLTPLAIVSSFLCVEGAKRQVMWGNSLEAGCLMALATFLITIYFVWNVLTFRFHLKTYLKWRSKNYNVKLVRVQRVSTANEENQNMRCVQVVSQPNSNNITPNVIISIPDSTENAYHSNVFASI